MLQRATLAIRISAETVVTRKKLEVRQICWISLTITCVAVGIGSEGGNVHSLCLFTQGFFVIENGFHDEIITEWNQTQRDAVHKEEDAQSEDFCHLISGKIIKGARVQDSFRDVATKSKVRQNRPPYGVYPAARNHNRCLLYCYLNTRSNNNSIDYFSIYHLGIWKINSLAVILVPAIPLTMTLYRS